MTKLDITIYDLFGEKNDSGYVLVDAKKVNQYINLAKTLQAEHEALKKDVARLLKINRDLRPFIEELETLKKDIARYFELEQQFYNGFSDDVDDETLDEIDKESEKLKQKLSKVGNKE